MKTAKFISVVVFVLFLISCKKDEPVTPLYTTDVYSCKAFLRNTNIPFKFGKAVYVHNDEDGDALSSTEVLIDANGFFTIDTSAVGEVLYVERGDSVACFQLDNCATEFNAIPGILYRKDVIPVSSVKIKIIDELPLSDDTSAVWLYNYDFYGNYPTFTTVYEGDSVIRNVEGCIEKSFMIKYMVNGVFQELLYSTPKWIGAFDTTTVTIKY